MAKVIERDGVSNAYIYPVGKSAGEITINPPAGSTCKLYTAESDEPTVLDKATTLKVGPVKYQHLVGLTYDQLMKACPGAKPAAQDSVVRELLSELTAK